MISIINCTAESCGIGYSIDSSADVYMSGMRPLIVEWACISTIVKSVRLRKQSYLTGISI